MSSQHLVYACVAAGLLSALVAGVFQAFSDFVMRGLLLAEPAGGIESMQQINRTVYRSFFLTSFFALVPVTAGLAAYGMWNLAGAARGLLLAAAGIYLVSVFLVTVVGNVPMNEHLDGMAYGSAEAADYWRTYGRVWTYWNHLRTLGSTLTALCLILAALTLTGS